MTKTPSPSVAAVLRNDFRGFYSVALLLEVAKVISTRRSIAEPYPAENAALLLSYFDGNLALAIANAELLVAADPTVRYNAETASVLRSCR
jgi:hypothetical protein